MEEEDLTEMMKERFRHVRDGNFTRHVCALCIALKNLVVSMSLSPSHLYLRCVHVLFNMA